MPLKLQIFLLFSFAITFVIDRKAFLCHRKANFPLYCIGFKESSQLNRNELVSTSLSPGHRCEAKGVIVYTPAPLIDFAGKIASQIWPSWLYRAVSFVLPLQNFITGLSKMATKSTNTNFSFWRTVLYNVNLSFMVLFTHVFSFLMFI